MKTKYIMVLLLLLCFSIATGQNKEAKTELPKSENLLDMQANYYTDILGETITNGKDPNTIDGYKELVEASELTPEQKEEAKRNYDKIHGVQAKTKDSIF